MSSAEFETGNPARKRLQTYVLDRKATGIVKTQLSFTTMIFIVMIYTIVLC